MSTEQCRARWAAWMIALAIVGGCGSARSAGTTTADSSSASGGSTRGRQGEGAPCDFGGAAAMTCTAPLRCCYGPPDDPGEVGHCQPACP